MKKFLSIILTFVILFTCCACSIFSTEQTSNENNEESNTYTMNSEEEALAEILIIGSQIFKDPTSTKVKNVWTYKSATCYFYTFELESKNGYGNMVSDYYGGMLLQNSLDNSAVEKVKNSMPLQDFMYFSKDQLTALQNGTAINSDCIPVMQDYFIKNYHE